MGALIIGMGFWESIMVYLQRDYEGRRLVIIPTPRLLNLVARLGCADQGFGVLDLGHKTSSWLV